MKNHRRNFMISTTASFASAVIAGSAMGEPGPFNYHSQSGEINIADVQRLSGQRIIVGFHGTRASDAGVKSVFDKISKGLIAGVLLLRRNIESISQLVDLCAFLKSSGRTQQPLICIDQEGGAVARASEKAGFAHWASASEITTTFPDQNSSFEYYLKRAAELAFVGINFNFAPVVDLNVNPLNPVIGALGRSFSARVDDVVRQAESLIQAHQIYKIRTCLKHFPGHGSSSSDSHKNLPDISRSWTAQELEPFKRIVNDKLCDCIMMGHLLHPRFSDGAHTPSSLSIKSVSVLRDEILFRGPIITDDLQMGAITENYSEKLATTLAARAGNDLLIFSTSKRADENIGARINDILVTATINRELDINMMAASAYRVAALRRTL